MLGWRHSQLVQVARQGSSNNLAVLLYERIVMLLKSCVFSLKHLDALCVGLQIFSVDDLEQCIANWNLRLVLLEKLDQVCNGRLV